MQTKQQIQRLLASAGISPNKRRGQHFLIDLNLMRLLVNSANIAGRDIVLEVGCGTGSLTEALAERAVAVIGVEIEESLAEIVRQNLVKARNVKIICTDILETKNTISRTVTEALRLAKGRAGGRLLLVSNLPYSVACPVMVNLTAGPVVAEAMFVTVQKEVADRMTASPGGDDYGTLSILLSATGDLKAIRTLKPSVFWPAPQVDSAMVSFVRNENKVRRIHNMELFDEAVSLFMGHRRKMLRACTKFTEGRLAGIHDWHDIFGRAFIDPHNRPEQLSPEDYIAIANLCGELLG
ncbi:MAG: 16S rRNA (adenine(1518)-N(6)/adenine(1519)-N(6))-dimethyltransferase RsmA [Planctomycetota bacterium]|jgi:16S rRNA (adenine1518-N6/adenine1519-N6)-dimethyltransferase